MFFSGLKTCGKIAKKTTPKMLVKHNKTLEKNCVWRNPKSKVDWGFLPRIAFYIACFLIFCVWQMFLMRDIFVVNRIQVSLNSIQEEDLKHGEIGKQTCLLLICTNCFKFSLLEKHCWKHSPQKRPLCHLRRKITFVCFI